MTPPRRPHLYVDDDGRLRMVIDEATLFGKITMAMVSNWTEDGLRLLTNHLEVSAEHWSKATLQMRSEAIGRLVDLLWLKAAEDRTMLVAVGRPRMSLAPPKPDAPVDRLPVVTERTEFPTGVQRVTLSLRGYAMLPAATDLNM